MAADHMNGVAGRPESGAASPDVQLLLERIAFLEEQIAELRRASMVEKALFASRYARTSRRTSRLRKFRGKIRDKIRHAFASGLGMRPVVRLVRKVAQRVFSA
jgi:hypothetical protein